MEDPSSEEKQSLASVELVLDLCFKEAYPDHVLSFLIRRVKEGKVLPLLCCRKLTFVEKQPPYPIMEKILQKVQLHRVQEVEIKRIKEPLNPARIVPYLGQMVHLNRLHLSEIITDPQNSQTLHEMHSVFIQPISQFLRLNQLQHIHLDSVYFLHGHLGKVLRYLDTRLQTLCITNCLLLDLDLIHLSLCPGTSHLRSLDLSRVILSDIDPDGLRILLSTAWASLEYLDLSWCRISDSQLTAILPALSLCSRLQHFRFYRNPVTSAGLESRLRQMLPPPKSTLLVLPIPLDCYRDF
ncbi:PREDICTED: melanoma antigen preferentially expressed in tumors-like [Elephantulus edwardii]|uniref:melanoma antigen preferentially expressed in tumors-like n=1 Tax=Elephantulus edwardii TaxID=28737 RepID=UPI0003F0C3AE|nr:PREDICTED: melanoma antigen preferentially expressed in tumors-like [Elephantulus edwardii]